jgi:hypothetical protein
VAAEIWVVNASPVIALSRIGRADLLLRLTQEVWIVDGVASELLAGSPGDAARQLIEVDSDNQLLRQRSREKFFNAASAEASPKCWPSPSRIRARVPFWTTSRHEHVRRVSACRSSARWESFYEREWTDCSNRLPRLFANYATLASTLMKRRSVRL